MNRTGSLSTAVIAVTAIFGCFGSPDGLEFVPVSGVVTVNDVPAANMTVVFEPIGDAEGGVVGPASRGRTDADGRFVLRTTTGTLRAAAVVGTHRVVVIGAERYDATSDEGVDPSAVPTYRLDEADRRGLTFVVPPGGTAAADFSLEGVAVTD